MPSGNILMKAIEASQSGSVSGLILGHGKIFPFDFN